MNKLKSGLLIGAISLLLVACNGGSSSDRVPFTPNGEVFSDFVTSLFSADQATAEPVEINDRNFSFLDTNNTSAFDDQLK